MTDPGELKEALETDDRDVAIDHALSDNFWMPMQRVVLGGWNGIIIAPTAVHWNDLIVSTVRLEWGGPHKPILQAIPFEVVPRNHEALKSAVERATEKRRSELVECSECGKLTCPGYMMADYCHGCASANHNILF
jgi:hypothetical protein